MDIFPMQWPFLVLVIRLALRHGLLIGCSPSVSSPPPSSMLAIIGPVCYSALVVTEALSPSNADTCPHSEPVRTKYVTFIPY